MNKTDKHLDKIFNKARMQAPKASFEEISTRFIAAIVATGGGFAAGYWVSKLFSLKGGILLTSVLASTALVFSISKHLDYQETNKTIQEITQQDTVQTEKVTETSQAMLLNNERTDSSLLLLRKSTSDLSEPSTQLPSYANLEDLKIQSTISQTNGIDFSKFLIQRPNIDMPDIPQKTIQDTSKLKGIPILFTVTESTPEEEFSRITKLARKSGIDCKSRVHGQRVNRFRELSLIRDFEVDMAIPGDTCRIQVAVPKRGKFEVIFGWYTNKQGTVIALSDSVTITKATSFYPKD